MLSAIMFYVEYKGPIRPERGQYSFRRKQNEKDVCEGDKMKAGP